MKKSKVWVRVLVVIFGVIATLAIILPVAAYYIASFAAKRQYEQLTVLRPQADLATFDFAEEFRAEARRSKGAKPC